MNNILLYLYIMNNKKPKKYYRIILNSGFANTSNSWYQVKLPGLMDDPFKKWQWHIDQWFVYVPVEVQRVIL